ncbi:elongation factor EF-2 [Thermococcus celericrescens]|uniref:Elongation factor 2 n=1 Tax=Thermococcus celericrescens TaxID=227598 RepID=A0A117ITR7_9EURY|nr:elongation factor EF-2 [Thermococcus celericrescens]KUH34114.1 elongation factor EF-2 [Thermococcus celericrescens]
MGRREEMVAKIKELMTQPERIRNMGIAAHIDHGKTTLSDNLLAGAGMISEELAGKQLVLDFDEQEQARGITINAANVSMVHTYEGNDYLINLIDTPGHVDFGGDVTRAMRAIDGAIIVVDAVEGVMPQTETVLRQALREYVKPVLFINKVDRLIKELKLGPNDILQRFAKIITDVNRLIKKYAPDEFKNQWFVKVEDGSVAFGSAYYNWALSVPYMKKTGVSFKDIVELTNSGDLKTLRQKAPLHVVVLDMVVKHLPNPLEAQKYRIPHLWRGDVESEVGQAMMNCDPKGKMVMVVTKIILDKHAGEVSTGRVWSGTVKTGQEVYLINAKRKARIQQVGIYMGPERVNMEAVPAGNIVAVTGLRDAMAGETVSQEQIEPFEALHYASEPVVTVAIEAKNVKDLPKLIEALRQLAKEDPTLHVKIDEETGQHLLSGMGELHLEVKLVKLKEDWKLDVDVSPPIVVYRESVSKISPIVEGKSPNKHNRFYITVEPLPDEIYQAIHEGLIPEGRPKDPKAVAKKLAELGMDYEVAKGIVDIYHGNIFLDNTKGIQYLNEVMDLLVDGFHQAMDEGPLAKEPVMKVMVRLHDAKIHEDNVHRGPAQIYPAIRSAIQCAMMKAQPILYEPYQKVIINVPYEYMGAVSREINQRRGQLIDMRQEGEVMIIISEAPVAEMFGFAGAIRGATSGRALWSTEHAGFKRVPGELATNIIRQIRQRKGLDPNPPREQDVCPQQ